MEGLLNRQNLEKPRCFGFSPIPEWTDEEICAIERRDVHGSRCRCKYCKDRSHELEVRRSFAAQRKADKQAEEDQARRLPAAAKVILDRVFGTRHEVRYLTGEELLEFLEYRHSETTKFQSTGTLRSA